MLSETSSPRKGYPLERTCGRRTTRCRVEVLPINSRCCRWSGQMDSPSAAYVATGGPPCRRCRYSPPSGSSYSPPQRVGIPPGSLTLLPPSSTWRVSVAEEIAKLATLHSSGALTDEEFTAHKARLL